MNYEVLRLENINYFEKTITILNNITLNLFSNEILCLFIQDKREREVLCDLLCGIKKPNSGRIYIDDHLVNFECAPGTPSVVNTINEISNFIPVMSVAKNLFITDPNYYTLGITNEKKMISAARILLEKTGLTQISPSMNVMDLTNAQKHLLNIAKAVQMEFRILVINNITNEYSVRELIELRNTIERLKNLGLPIIIMVNKYNDLFDIFDRVTLVSHGTTIKTLQHDEISKINLLSNLKTHLVQDIFQSSSIQISKPFFSARNICANMYGLNQVSFDVARGEVLGIWDVDWNYSYLLVDSIFGIIPYTGIYSFNEYTGLS